VHFLSSLTGLVPLPDREPSHQWLGYFQATQPHIGSWPTISWQSFGPSIDSNWVRMLSDPFARHCAGMVIRGSFSSPVFSAMVNRNMMAVKARFERQSRSSTQNHWPR